MTGRGRRGSTSGGPSRGGSAVRLFLAGVVLAALVAAGLVISDGWVSTPVVQECEARAGSYQATIGLTESRNAALVAAVAVRRGMPARAATIALATAFQESGLRNLRYGHLDSVGLFQQRPSQGWGTREQILDPYYAANRFYTALDRVDGYATLDIAEAAQRVQRSADGGAYAQHEVAARALASALTGQSAAAFSCRVRGTTRTAASARAVRDQLARAFGEQPTATVAGGLTVAVADRERGWAVAQWAVANAHDLGLNGVSYDGRAWELDRSGDGWRRAARAAGTSRVRLALASRDG